MFMHVEKSEKLLSISFPAKLFIISIFEWHYCIRYLHEVPFAYTFDANLHLNLTSNKKKKQYNSIPSNKFLNSPY